MKSIHPTQQQLADFLASEKAGPIVMVNLLKFASEKEGSDPGGKTLYERYMMRVAPLLEKVGGRLIWMGDVDEVLIGSDADEWDRVLLVAYPSRKHFMQMISDPMYQEIQNDRSLSLVNSALLASTTIIDGVNNHVK